MTKPYLDFSDFCSLGFYSSFKAQISSDRECHLLCFQGVKINQYQMIF